MSLQPQQRIRKQYFFKLITSSGTFARGRYINLWDYTGSEVWNRGEKKNRPKLGVIVSKKTDKHATKRNLWKRRIREAFRLNQKVIKPGHSIIIQAKRIATVPTFVNIEKDLLTLLSEVKAKRVSRK